MERLEELTSEIAEYSSAQIMSWAWRTFGSAVELASSLGIEDQVLTHLLAANAPEMRIFTLDTGRLFEETYRLLHETRSEYGVEYTIYFPDTQTVEQMVSDRGVNLFYDSVENRKLCCAVRKVEPLRRALTSLSAWVCGLRRDQSVDRNTVEPVAWDEANGLFKICPLFDWTSDDVLSYATDNNVPYNPLHDAGFLSIGCAPCTRAVEPGGDARSGRWWWEEDDHRECGLHSATRAQAEGGHAPVMRVDPLSPGS